MEGIEQYTIDHLLLVAQGCLLEEINPSLRGLAVAWNNACAVLYFYHDGKLDSEMEDHYSCIGTQIISNYYQATIDEQIISLEYPKPLPHYTRWAYRRKEPFVDPGRIHKVMELGVESPTIGHLLLVIQNCLLGQITHLLRGVAIAGDKDRTVYFYLDGKLDSEMQDHYSKIGKEINASLPYTTIDTRIVCETPA